MQSDRLLREHIKASVNYHTDTHRSGSTSTTRCMNIVGPYMNTPMNTRMHGWLWDKLFVFCFMCFVSCSKSQVLRKWRWEGETKMWWLRRHFFFNYRICSLCYRSCHRSRLSLIIATSSRACARIFGKRFVAPNTPLLTPRSKSSPLLRDPHRNVSHGEDDWAAMRADQSNLFTYYTVGLFPWKVIHHSRLTAVICLQSTSAQLTIYREPRETDRHTHTYTGTV